MGRSARRRSTLGLLVVLVSSPRGSEAAEAPFDVDLAYEAPAQCPRRGEIVAELRRRVDPSSRAELERQRDRRSFVVRIERLANGAFSGRLELTRPGGPAQSREFRAETCRAVSSALTVFIAIALDPANTDEAGPAPPPTFADENDSTAPPSSDSPPASPAPPSRPALPPASAPPPVQARTGTWVWSSEVGVAYVRTPRDAWGARVAGQIAYAIEGARVAPALRVSWGFADFDAPPADGGRASFRFASGRAAACALVRLAPAPFTVAPCVGLGFGSLAATSGELPRVGQASTGWYAMSGIVRAAWSLLPWLSLDAEVGVETPFRRPMFALTDPFRIVYRPPGVLVTGGAGLAVSARFP
jgi:hypothetical protein